MSTFNLNKALSDDCYAGDININLINCNGEMSKQSYIIASKNDDCYIDGHLYISLWYNDIIFTLSCIYASNIPLEFWIKEFEKSFKNNRNTNGTSYDILQALLETASLTHCLDFEEAVIETIQCTSQYLDNYANKNGLYKKRILNKSSGKYHAFKYSHDARKWVKDNISPILLPILYNSNDGRTISTTDIVNALRSVNNNSDSGN